MVDAARSRAPYGLSHLTLSTANCSDLSAGVRSLISSFRRLRQRKLWRSHVSGGAYVIEVTGHPGSWHPHLHIIIESTYIEWSQLLSAWQSVSGGSSVYIQRIPGKQAVAYLTKYISKPSVNTTLLSQLNAALKDTRMFQPFGTWHSVRLPVVKKSYPCPECGCDVWVPEILIDIITHKFRRAARATPREIDRVLSESSGSAYPVQSRRIIT